MGGFLGDMWGNLSSSVADFGANPLKVTGDVLSDPQTWRNVGTAAALYFGGSALMGAYGGAGAGAAGAAAGAGEGVAAGEMAGYGAAAGEWGGSMTAADIGGMSMAGAGAGAGEYGVTAASAYGGEAAMAGGGSGAYGTMSGMDFMGAGGDVFAGAGGGTGAYGTVSGMDLLGAGGGDVAGAGAGAGGSWWGSMFGGGGSGTGGSMFSGLKAQQVMGGMSALQGIGTYMGARKADPYAGAREQALSQMQALEADPSSISSIPGYQAGLGATQRTLAAQGYTGSGRAQVEMMNYGTNAYNQRLQQLQQMASMGDPTAQGRMEASGASQMGIGAALMFL